MNNRNKKKIRKFLLYVAAAVAFVFLYLLFKQDVMLSPALAPSAEKTVFFFSSFLIISFITLLAVIFIVYYLLSR